MSEEKISPRAALALGNVCQQTERVLGCLTNARVYLGAGKIENARFGFRTARREVQTLSAKLKKLDEALRNNLFMPQTAPLPPQPTGSGGLKVIK